VLFGPFTPALTKGRKNAEWNKVAEAVNKVGTNNRDVNEVKRKWENLKSIVKNKLATDYKASTMRKTGGGSPECQLPSSEDDRMLSIIGISSVRGIVGGIDSSLNIGGEYQTLVGIKITQLAGRHADVEGTVAKSLFKWDV
jgi:hypothetical protein